MASGPPGAAGRALLPSWAAGGWFEVPVNGFAGHAEGFGDLGDGVLTSVVSAGLVVHAAGHLGLLALCDPVLLPLPRSG